MDELVVKYSDLYVEYYVHEVITYERVNIRFRMRSNRGHLLEVSEALGIESDMLTFIDYRHHFQDPDNTMIFRYDSAPHHPQIQSFPHHKHLPDKKVVPSSRLDLEQIIEEAVRALHH